MGVPKFRDAFAAAGHPVVIEQKVHARRHGLRAGQLQVIRGSPVDAIVLWADEIEAAQIRSRCGRWG